MRAVEEHAPRVGVFAMCMALALARATFYRRRKAKRVVSRRPSPPRSLSAQERSEVLSVLREPRFVDLAPAQVYATLLDENRYLCSERTMYRVLAAHGEVRERRDQLTHPAYAKPELLATAPNQLWSWDITKLRGPAKWTCYHLYVILDVFSRYVVGWMVADHESATLASRLIEETLERQGIKPGQLTLHADRGASMRSKTVALLLADLGVAKTHSRPHVSDDNPFSESQFKTIKYRPEFPDRFGSVEDARSCSGHLLDWYNHEHRHGELGLLTPYEVHHGLVPQRLTQRAAVLEEAYRRHPERFRALPRPTAPAKEVWINPPAARQERREGPLPAMMAPQPQQDPGSPEGPKRSGGAAERLDAGSCEGYAACHPEPSSSEEVAQ